MNAIAAPEIAPEVAAPSMEMLLYLAEFEDAAVLAKEAVATADGGATPAAPARPLARNSHHPSTADADPLAVTGRTPSGRLNVVSATPAPSSGPCAPPQRRLDALATTRGEKCGPGPGAPGEADLAPPQTTPANPPDQSDVAPDRQ